MARSQSRYIWAVWFVFLMLMGRAGATLSSVTVGNSAINAITTYTWAISFTAASPHNPIVLTFPSQVTVLSNCTVQIGSIGQIFNCTSTTVTITSTINVASVSIVVGNVQNPGSAISSSGFSYTNNDGTQFLSTFTPVVYTTGSFASCTWSFSQCTESPSSDLLIPITTVNKLSSGTNYFLIGYGTTWANHFSKGLVTAGGSVSCSYSLDGGANYISGTACTISAQNRIEFRFSSGNIAGGTNIIVRVSGVNSPPTMTTSTSSNYFIYTADASLVKIDGLASCPFANTCITNSTSGVFNTSMMTVNANYGNPQVLFPLTPLTITLQQSDTVDISYSPLSSLTTCSTFIIYRSGSTLYTLPNPTFGSSSITFTFPSSSGYNTEYTYPVYTYLQCSAFLMPPSETPVALTFNFKRNSDLYMTLSGTITAVAATFNSSKGKVSLTSTAMATSSNATFNFLIGQPLSSTPAVAITFSPDFVIGTPICTVAVLTLTISSSSCSLNNATNTVTVILAASSGISVGSNFTITVGGLRNPGTPKAYTFSMSTYYNSNVSTSRVETSPTAFSTTITEIVNYPVTLSPSGLTVYSRTLIILSFVPNITIPTLSNFLVEFPANITSLTPNTDLLKVASNPQPLSGSLSTTLTNVAFVSGAQLSAGSSVTIQISLVTPSNIGTYSYVKLTISNNNTKYLSTTSELFLNVNAVSSMSVTITPTLPVTGAVSNYTFSIVLSIPHSTSFIVQIDVPSDTKFINSGANCSSCNATSMSSANSSTFSFTASNPTGTNATSISFTISSFTNPRSVGVSALWGIATKTANPVNLISYSYANANIQSTSLLTATLSKSDSYYRGNTSPVKMTISFFNTLMTGDYLLLTFTSDSYTGTSSSIKCSPIYGACSVLGTPTNVTVVKISPNITSIVSSSLFAIVEGLTSAANTPYSFTTNITVTSFNSSGSPMDSGKMAYNISCGVNSSFECKQCYSNGSCLNCYVGYYLQGAVCVSVCADPTTYSNTTTGTCANCTNNCKTCSNETVCLSCIAGYYYYTKTYTCQLSCPTTAGYFISNVSCSPCSSNCMECINASNTCLRCDSLTLLINGACQSGCGSSNYYQLNGQCLPCDPSCYACSGAGPGSCINCSAAYHRYLTSCVQYCPTGVGVQPLTGDCGCDTDCLTCSNYSVCTACNDPAMWVSNGRCIAVCPNATYATAGQCIPCSAGCLSCTINTCTTCVANNYLFNNTCYSDCNLVSKQHDALGSTCVLCPTGCDFCTGTTCTSCLDDYTLTAGTGQCTRTCLLTNTCDLTSQVLPMPGVLALGLWFGISVIIHFLYHKNYLPYSVMLLSGVIQFVLMLALVSSTSTPARLLVADTAYLGKMRGLLAGAIAINYLENVAYLVIFLVYIRPLITNPRQIDVISNVVVLIIAVATNFRFGLVAFARMFPKPNIFVRDASKLTPIHYLCLLSVVLDLLSLVACGLGVINSLKLSNTFMLSLDLIIVIAINIAITIFFVAAKKPDEYFEDTIKKYSAEDNGHTPTDETLPNEKNLSKANMAGNGSLNFDDFDQTENDEASYNKFTNQRANSNQLHLDDTIKENPLPVTVSKRNSVAPEDDPNFENNIKSKRTALRDSAIIISKPDFAKNMDKEGKSVDDNLSSKKSQIINKNLAKDPKTERKKAEPQKNIIEVEESDYPDLEQTSEKGAANVFNSRQRPAKPKKVKDPKGKAEETKPKEKGMEQSRGRGKGLEEPMKLMKKGDKKIGYFESDAYESNADGEDLEEIIKQKIWQSTIKLEKPSLASGAESETGHEEISPSWFNIQNQRLDITDLDEADPE